MKETVWLSPIGDLVVFSNGLFDAPSRVWALYRDEPRMFFMNPTAGSAWLLQLLGYEELGDL